MLGPSSQGPPTPPLGPGWGLTRGLVVVDADALQLQVRIPYIIATGVYPVLVADEDRKSTRLNSSH